VGLTEGWGPILEIWEGHASDPEIRVEGSSGGVATAIAQYSLEHRITQGVVHIAADGKEPWRNHTVISRSRSELLERTGSRYSPASPCDVLGDLDSDGLPFAFIGKPCDVVGLRKLSAVKQELQDKIALCIGFFCAGTPSTRGTLDLLAQHQIHPPDINEVRYRGRGWPGMAMVRLKGQNVPVCRLSYMESWGFLQKYRPFRCYLCPDGTGEFADISCGDPWYREIGEKEVGYSLVLVRTARGRSILQGAIEAQYVTLEKVGDRVLGLSQKNLLKKRSAIWGRLLALRLLRIPAPELKGFFLFENWIQLCWKEKIKSILGTVRRAFQRNYFNPIRDD
jgi:coenzyme F420 hydrogenase subunit beta